MCGLSLCISALRNGRNRTSTTTTSPMWRGSAIPEATLYQLPAFGLSRTNPYLHFLHLTVLKGWLKGAMFKYGIGMIKEDAEQMPGVFFLKERKIVRAFRHRTIADEPDYLKLVGAG